MLIHAITADGPLADLSMASKFNTEWSFLEDLKARGRAAAEAWLEADRANIGVRSSIDLQHGLP